jgi:hypothetical protein
LISIAEYDGVLNVFLTELVPLPQILGKLLENLQESKEVKDSQILE